MSQLVVEKPKAAEILAAADEDYRSGAYAQAIDKYERYLDKFPNDPNVSAARVRIGTAQLWQHVDSRDKRPALEAAGEILPQIENEAAFADARPELTAILSDIGGGFASQAKAEEDIEKAKELVDLAERAMELVNNPSYIPTSLRRVIETKLNGIHEDIQLAKRNINRTRRLDEAVAAIQADAPQPAIAPFDADQAKQHQQSWAKHLGVPVKISNEIGMKLRLIPAGEFSTGSPESGESGDDEQHPTQISKPFYLQTTEVTQGQWKSVMDTEPWSGKKFVKVGANYAAAYVTWDDAEEFCRQLSGMESTTYRLPTEAEWEYACRGGTTAAYFFGDDSSLLGDYAWFAANASNAGGKYAHEVGQKRPNDFGLYDMHGNVSEWCRTGTKSTTPGT